MPAHLNPTAEQMQQFAEHMPADTPILMLNLLRFHQEAHYPDGSPHAACSGAEAYARYSRTALTKVREAGGEVQVMARAHVALIAPADEHWDRMLLVRYPSRAAFLAMLADPDYRAATDHRTAALADSRLIGCTERS